MRRGLLLILLALPAMAGAQSLTRGMPPPRPPQVCDRPHPAPIPRPAGWPNLDPFAPQPAPCDGRILTPAFGRGG